MADKYYDMGAMQAFYDKIKTIFQTIANKVTSWSNTPSDDKYPSEKLVKDSLDTKVNTSDAIDVVAGSNVNIQQTASGVEISALENLVTSWQGTPDDTHYPSEKLVKNALDEKVPVVSINGSIPSNSTKYIKMSITASGYHHYFVFYNGSMGDLHAEWLFRTYGAGGTGRTTINYIGAPVTAKRWYVAGSSGNDWYIEFPNSASSPQSIYFRVAALDASKLPTLTIVDSVPDGYVEKVATGTVAAQLLNSRKLAVSLSNTSTDTSFNGSADVTNIKTTGTLDVEHGGTGNTSVDTAPTANSTKMVTSGGIKTALDSKANETESVYYVVGTSDYVAYSASSTYTATTSSGPFTSENSCIYSGKAYFCKTAITTPEAWNSSHWTAIATPVLTGTIDGLTSLYAGLKIAYKMPITGGSSSTYLNINNLGNKYIRRNDSNLTTHLPANTVVFLAYDGTYWRWADYDADNYYTSIGVYCSTAAVTQAKVGTSAGHVNTAGEAFLIRFINANTYNGKLTLNINSQGAKDIWINGAVSSSSNKTIPAGEHWCYYDGTVYHIWTDGTAQFKKLKAETFTGNVSGTATSAAGYTSDGAIATALSGKVSTATTVNGKALSGNISLAASDVSAVPLTRKINGYALSADVTLYASNVSAVPLTRTINGSALSADITINAASVSAIATSAVGVSGGVAPLGSNGKVSTAYLPTIPAAQVNSDWNATTGVAEILNKPMCGVIGVPNAKYLKLSIPRGIQALHASLMMQTSHNSTQILGILCMNNYISGGTETLTNVSITILRGGKNAGQNIDGVYEENDGNGYKNFYLYFGDDNAVHNVYWTWAGGTNNISLSIADSTPSSTSTMGHSYLPVIAKNIANSSISVGSEYRPVYISNNGRIEACTYAISTATTGTDVNTIYLV